MSWYRYTARDGAGAPVEGKVQAADIPSAQRELEARGFEGITLAGEPDARRRGRGASARELAILAQQIAVVIRSDITLVEGLDTLIEQSENGEIKRALTQVVAALSAGGGFADALSHHGDVFPRYFLSMVRIGEVSGSLDAVMERLAAYYEKEHRLRRKVRAAVMYPVILTALMLGVIALMVWRVLPMFSGILSGLGGQMPLLTRAVMAISAFLSQNGWWVLLAVAALALARPLYGRTQTGKRWYDKHLISGAIGANVRKKLITARFCSAMALLLQSGVSVGVALGMVSELLDNSHVSTLLEKAVDEVSQGKALDESIRGMGLFPALLLRMISVGQRTGRLDDMLVNSASLFDEEVDSALERMTNAIEPALIILLSLIVGVILFSIMLPMIDILSAI